jgi:hypothetical protein
LGSSVARHDARRWQGTQMGSDRDLMIFMAQSATAVNSLEKI